MRLSLLAATALLLAGPVSAQVPPVKNPSAVEFLSADHAQATGYEIDIITTTGAVLTTITTGKGTQAPDGTVTVSLNVQPIAFGTYTIRVRTVASGLESVDSEASDPFERVPGPPSKPTLK